MTLEDQLYYLRRLIQEDLAAARASCAAARERHEELAALYRARCSEEIADLAAQAEEEQPNPAARPMELVA